MSFVKKIRIRNFKNLEDAEIEVTPLTLLFGPNGSGKSSFMKALLFLSKNLFPNNPGKTIYNIDDNIDLISYKDIVTNNEFERDIIFTLSVEGKYDFPSRKIFSKEYLDEGYLPKNLVKDLEFEENTINQLYNNINKCNLFDFFDKYSEYFNEEYKSKRFDQGIPFSVTYEIAFNNNLTGFNLKYLKITDKNSKYSFSVGFDVIGVGLTSRYAFNEELEMKNDLPVYKLFEKIYKKYSNKYNVDPYYKSDEYCSYPNINIEKFHTLEYMNNDIAHINGAYRNYVKHHKISFEELKDVHFEVFRFIYISHRMTLYLIIDFLRIKHLPLTREIPKTFYNLNSGSFDEKDYYNFLNPLFQSQAENKQDANLISVKKDSRIELFKFLINNEKEEDPWNLWNYQLKHFIYCVNEWLLFFDLSILKIEKIYGVGVLIIVGKDNQETNLSNASSGYIQILPIILFMELMIYDKLRSIESIIEKKLEDSQSINYLYNENYRTGDSITDFELILIEQPELHLHPKLQSKLAELFSFTSHITGKVNSVFVETHSEHLIRKLQILISKNEMDKDKVRVYYFNNGQGITSVEEMKIDEKGLFEKDWPNGFFDDSKNLTMEMLEALRKRNN